MNKYRHPLWFTTFGLSQSATFMLTLRENTLVHLKIFSQIQLLPLVHKWSSHVKSEI